MRRADTIVLLSLLLVSLLSATFNIREARATGTIYIRADGSIEPPTANITTVDNVTYTFTGNNYDSIVVERSHIVVDGAGYSLQGSGSGRGFSLSNRTNVIIQNTNIQGFGNGITLNSSSSNTIAGNNMTANNGAGIIIYGSLNNVIADNNVTNNGAGIGLISSSNNTIAGNSITASSSFIGIWLSSWSKYNVIAGNNVANNRDGIELISSSSNNIIVGNSIMANSENGILLSISSNNVIAGNDISANARVFGAAISVSGGSNNVIAGNNVADNTEGILIDGLGSVNATIVGNNVTDNDYGIHLYSFSNIRIYHNNLIDNTNQLVTSPLSLVDALDDGYPSGGNYWSDYADVDSFRGPHQNETGSDGIWDHPYVIDELNMDRFPLTEPFSGLTGDVDGDRDVDIFDIVRMAGVYGVTFHDSRYDWLCDMDLDGDIDIFDIVMAAVNYGKNL